MGKLLISIVSHEQGALVRDLLSDLSKLSFSEFTEVKVVVTLNRAESEDFLSSFSGDLTVIRNLRQLGFGANHNQAYSLEKSDYFLVLNPDIRLESLNFKLLTDALSSKTGVIAPSVYSPEGGLEDSCRTYPSVWKIFKRVVLKQREIEYALSEHLKTEDVSPISVDWVAGMFMLFDSSTFRDVGGFDTSYFMYLEDADICRRVNQTGRSVSYLPAERVIHAARRKSHKDWQHKRWHLRSMLRFLWTA